MSRMLGTVSMGVRAPIIRQGDDMVKIVTDCILDAMKYDGLQPRNRDIVAMTEAIVARAQGNYATVDNIADDVRAKLGGETVGVIFPILSRNRFAICLRGIAKGAKKIYLMLSYPSDEVQTADADGRENRQDNGAENRLKRNEQQRRLTDSHFNHRKAFQHIRDIEAEKR